MDKYSVVKYHAPMRYMVLHAFLGFTFYSAVATVPQNPLGEGGYSTPQTPWLGWLGCCAPSLVNIVQTVCLPNFRVAATVLDTYCRHQTLRRDVNSRGAFSDCRDLRLER